MNLTFNHFAHYLGSPPLRSSESRAHNSSGGWKNSGNIAGSSDPESAIRVLRNGETLQQLRNCGAFMEWNTWRNDKLGSDSSL